jgi:hypothetical protein
MSGATGDPGKGFDDMNVSGESEEDVVLPAQEMHQHRNIPRPPQDALAARARSLPEAVLDGRIGKRPAGVASCAKGCLDEARFTAGIVRFYEAVIKEPIPEKMLRLIEEIAKREQES